MSKEKNKYDVANAKLFQKINLVWVVIFVLFIIFIIQPFKDKTPYWNQQRLKSEYVGKVSRKYIDKDNHSTSTLELENQKGSLTFYHFLNYYQLIEVGDSISKTENDSIFYIIKKDTIITFKFLVQEKI